MSLLPPSFSCKCLEILNEQNTLRPESCWSPSSYEVIAHFISTQIFSLSIKHLEYMKFTWQMICYVCDQCDHGWWGPWTQYCHWHASRPAEEGVQAFQIYIVQSCRWWCKRSSHSVHSVWAVVLLVGAASLQHLGFVWDCHSDVCNEWTTDPAATTRVATHYCFSHIRCRILLQLLWFQANSPLPICHLLSWESLAGQALCDE